jgi:hypothetical protein
MTTRQSEKQPNPKRSQLPRPKLQESFKLLAKTLELWYAV